MRTYHLEAFLWRKVALDDFRRDVTSRARNIASRPQGRQPCEDRVLLAQMMRREPFALLDHLIQVVCLRRVVVLGSGSSQGTLTTGDESPWLTRAKARFLSRADKRALESYLTRLMQHILQWQAQPERRSRSWLATIHNARKHISKLQADTPRFTDRLIHEQLWEDCLDSAHREAEGEINRDLPWTALSWEEVFERPYTLG